MASLEGGREQDEAKMVTTGSLRITVILALSGTVFAATIRDEALCQDAAKGKYCHVQPCVKPSRTFSAQFNLRVTGYEGYYKGKCTYIHQTLKLKVSIHLREG